MSPYAMSLILIILYSEMKQYAGLFGYYCNNSSTRSMHYWILPKGSAATHRSTLVTLTLCPGFLACATAVRHAANASAAATVDLGTGTLPKQAVTAAEEPLSGTHRTSNSDGTRSVSRIILNGSAMEYLKL